MALYKGNRLRTGRYSEVGRSYIITAVTLKRAPLFAHWAAGCAVARVLHAEHLSGRANSVAWVVMPDHIHWLVELVEPDVSALVCRIKARASLRVNTCLERVGPVWQKGFHDRAIRRTEDLKAAARYIVFNPVRAGLVGRVGDYSFWNAAWL